eukprot:13068242-Ditylum_brightwellii.AAC.1
MYKNVKFLSKKKWGDTEEYFSKAYVMSLFKDENVKKAIRASLSSAEVIEIGSLSKDATKQARSAPYMASKRK